MEEWISFASVAVEFFALVAFLAGIFTTYFGEGRSRTMGVVFIVLGILIGGIWGYLCMGQNAIIDVALLEVLKDATIYLIAAALGFLGAAGLFLLAIMKV